MAPHLPGELIHRILVLSLQPETALSSESLLERCRHLRSCSLVSKDWAPWAQKALYRHARIIDDPEPFTRAVEGTEDRLVKEVVSMRVRALDTCDDLGVERVLEMCNGLKQLFVDHHCCSSSILKSAPDLTHLHLKESDLEFFGTHSSLAPKLTHLSLVSMISQSNNLSDILDPKTLPSLTHLSLAADDGIDDAELMSYAVDDLSQGLASVAKQLTSLTLRDPEGVLATYMIFPWKMCTSLASLAITNGQDGLDFGSTSHLRSALLELPKSLSHFMLIHVESERTVMTCLSKTLARRLKAIRSALDKPLIAVQQLQRLVLPSAESLCDECYDSSWALLAKLEKHCESAGIQLEWKDSERAPYPTKFDDWESFLDEW